MVGTVAAQGMQGTAKVVNIKGSARYMTPDNSNWQPLRVGTVLKEGATIQTANDSYVDLGVNNEKSSAGFGSSMTPVSKAETKARQDAVRIFDNSVLTISKLSMEQTGADMVTDTQLDLKAGSIFGSVKKLSAGSKYKVKIPNGVAGIRGTIYYITSDGIISVISGSVVVAYMGPNNQPVTQEVMAGQQFNVVTGSIGAIPPDFMVPGAYIGGVQPIIFTVDHTIYTVSPTVGGSSSSGGGVELTSK